MIPGLPSLPNPQLLPMLHQAWLSRASTMPNSTMIDSPFSFPPTSLGGFPFPSPFFVPPVSTSSPDGGLAAEKRRREENAEDLSFSAKRFLNSVPTTTSNDTEVICPICSIAVRREDLTEHFETEVKCLDNIRSLSPISQRPISRSSRSFSTSPNKSRSSISPVSPNHPRYENRWERFERIRNKRRERVGGRQERRGGSHEMTNNSAAAVAREEKKAEDEDIDIGDSLSDCGSHHSETESSVTAYGPLQYTEADVLRSLNDDDNPTKNDNNDNSVADGSLMKCGSCRKGMRVPVLNVSCWHIKCEQCWLKSVGTSKSCSICSNPASVKDLRRVYV